MIDFEPALAGAQGRRSRTDPANIPGGAASEKMPLPAPMSEIWRTGKPHFRLGEGSSAVRSMQRHVLTSNLFRKQNHIFVLRIKKNAVPFESLEIPGRSERGGCPVPGNGHISKIEKI